jgi:hypothetical protein
LKRTSGTDVARKGAVGAQDLDMLPGGGERGRDLPHARIARPQPGVDLLQEFRLLLEAGRGERVLVAIELAVGPGRRRGELARIAGLDGRDRVGGAQSAASLISLEWA